MIAIRRAAVLAIALLALAAALQPDGMPAAAEEPRIPRYTGPVVDHADILDTRHNIALWTGEVGKPAEALRLFEELLSDEKRVLGPGHPDTLETRHNLTILSDSG